jgi:hypothetical protein
MKRHAIGLVLLAGLLGGGALEAEAQGRPLRADGQQALDFGELLGGLAQVVAPTDPVYAARIQISGRNRDDVLVSFLLPAALQGPGGAVVPLVFGPGSAGYAPGQDINSQIAFDPAVSSVLTLPGNGRGMIYLGGTALPPAQAVVGAYSATITLTLSYVGN